MRSLDSVPEDDDRAINWLQEVPGMISEAQVAGDVAKVFSRKVIARVHISPWLSVIADLFCR